MDPRPFYIQLDNIDLLQYRDTEYLPFIKRKSENIFIFVELFPSTVDIYIKKLNDNDRFVTLIRGIRSPMGHSDYVGSVHLDT